MDSIKSAFMRLSEFTEHQIPTLNAPGIAIGLTHREQILHVGVYGHANRETKKAVTPATLFQIGSISKSFASIILLQLQEQGLLDVNDPVTKHLPWFEIQSEYAPITLRHLMSHTAGIISGGDDTVSASTETWNLRYTKATAPPGKVFHYSNSGYKVLGLVLETLLKQPIGDILSERVIKPLTMTSTVPVISSAVRSSLAVGYGPFYDDRPLPPGGQLAPATWLESNTADGSICSTAEDMCKYLRMLLQQGQGLLTRQSFEQLIEPVVSTGEESDAKLYGLGMSILEIDGHHVIGHSGGMVGYTADMLADLDSGLGVIVLTNGPAKPEKISGFALKLVQAAWDEEELPEFSLERYDGELQPDDYNGKYCTTGRSFTLKATDGRLDLSLDADTVPLEPYGSDSFLIPKPAFELFPLQFKREKGRITEAVHGGERYVREGHQGEITSNSPAEWSQYPGHYRSHNPWLSNFRIVLRNGRLILIYPFGDEEQLHQIESGHFRIGDDLSSPEFIRFDVVINGKAMQAFLSGGVYSRTFTP